MNTSLLIIFGKPGAGKSYVADILEKQFGYFSYNGDDALPPDMRKKLFRKVQITDDMRRQFLENMITTIKKLAEDHERLVIHQTFLKEYMRKKLSKAFPDAIFLLVECDDAIREKRYMERKYFNLGIPYLRHMTNLFESVEIPHKTIQNNDEGPKYVTEQLSKLVA